MDQVEIKKVGYSNTHAHTHTQRHFRYDFKIIPKTSDNCTHTCFHGFFNTVFHFCDQHSEKTLPEFLVEINISLSLLWFRSFKALGKSVSGLDSLTNLPMWHQFSDFHQLMPSSDSLQWVPSLPFTSLTSILIGFSALTTDSWFSACRLN